MVRVVGKEGALGAEGGGGDYSSGVDGAKKIMRRYPGRGNYIAPLSQLLFDISLAINLSPGVHT